MLGHIFPIFANFKGGKGVATLVGAITGIYPSIVFVCFGVWLLVFLFSNYVSLASMTAGCCFPILVLFQSTTEWSRYNDISVTFIVFSFVIAGVLLWAHRKNIERLKNGTESKIYIWHKPTPPKPEDEKK